MNDIMLDFKDVPVSGNFSIPSKVDHDFESFRKMKHNRAESLEDGRVVIFVDSATVWQLEVT